MSLFPLPLAPFELLMLLDDRPEYPMVFQLVCEFTGTINRANAEQAWQICLQRHPLLTARIETQRGLPEWRNESPHPCPILWLDGSALPALEPLDPRREAGARMIVQTLPCGPRVSWHFHHTGSDGLGALTVIGDWLAAYHALTTGRDPHQALVELVPHQLAERTDFRRGRERGERNTLTVESTSSWRQRWAVRWSAWKIALRILTAKPAVIANHGKTNSTTTNPLVVHTIDAASLKATKAALQAQKISLNDLLLTALFQTLTHWNQQWSGVRHARLLRVTMPTSQRVPRDVHLPATNVMSYAFLDRREGTCLSKTELLNGIREETRAIHRGNLSRQFVETIAPLGRHPRLMRMMSHLRSFLSTVVLSNVGDPSHRFVSSVAHHNDFVIAGDLTLKRIFGTPPIRPGTRLSLGVTTYLGNLELAGFYDPRFLQAEDVEKLLASLAEGVVAHGAQQ